MVWPAGLNVDRDIVLGYAPELQGEMMELQARLAAVQDENRTLKGRLSVREELTFKENSYWRASPTGSDGPFCSPCFDDKGKLIRLHQHGKSVQCPSCNTHAIREPLFAVSG